MLSEERTLAGARATTAAVFLGLIGMIDLFIGEGWHLVAGSVVAFIVLFLQNLLLTTGKRGVIWFLISCTGWYVFVFSLYVIFYYSIYRLISSFSIYHLFIAPVLVFFAWRMIDGYSKLTTNSKPSFSEETSPKE